MLATNLPAAFANQTHRSALRILIPLQCTFKALLKSEKFVPCFISQIGELGER